MINFQPTIRRKPRPSQGHLHHRGAVMIEALLCLPIIFLFLALIMYFGLSFSRLQHVQVMDRYEVWRQVGEAPGPGETRRRENELNQTFFNDHATGITYEGDDLDYLLRAEELVISEAGMWRNESAEFYEDMFTQLPGPRGVQLTTTHPGSVTMLSRFDGPMTHGSARFGNDWRYDNGYPRGSYEGYDGVEGYARYLGSRVSHAAAIREKFYKELDDYMESLTGNTFAARIRRLYSATPEYRGPDIR